MKNRLLIIVLLSCIVFACEKMQTEQENTISIHVEKEFMSLSPDSIYSSVRYVPLETTDESIFYEIDKMVVWNENFFIFDKKQAAIFVFNHEGHYLHRLNKIGNGPGEYVRLDDFFISDSLLYALASTLQKIIVYDMDFNFIKDFSINTSATNIANTHSHIFLYSNFLSEDFKNVHVLDKNTGTIKNKYKSFLKKQRGVAYFNTGFAKYADSLYICFPYDYSIYQLTENSCEKYLHVDFGKNNTFDYSLADFSDEEREEYKKTHYSHICNFPFSRLNHLYISQRLLFFTSVFHCYEYKFFLNRISQQCNVGYISSSGVFPFADSPFMTIFNDQIITYILPETILDRFDEQEMKEKLIFPQDLLKQLKPTDNPVLGIYELKKEQYEN